MTTPILIDVHAWLSRCVEANSLVYTGPDRVTETLIRNFKEITPVVWESPNLVKAAKKFYPSDLPKVTVVGGSLDEAYWIACPSTAIPFKVDSFKRAVGYSQLKIVPYNQDFAFLDGHFGDNAFHVGKLANQLAKTVLSVSSFVANRVAPFVSKFAHHEVVTPSPLAFRRTPLPPVSPDATRQIGVVVTGSLQPSNITSVCLKSMSEAGLTPYVYGLSSSAKTKHDAFRVPFIQDYDKVNDFFSKVHTLIVTSPLESIWLPIVEALVAGVKNIWVPANSMDLRNLYGHYDSVRVYEKVSQTGFSQPSYPDESEKARREFDPARFTANFQALLNTLK
jgi:hypothetical protein